jgi:hypothetical protein
MATADSVITAASNNNRTVLVTFVREILPIKVSPFYIKRLQNDTLSHT